MLMDYNASKGLFYIVVPKTETGVAKSLMTEHGFNRSRKDSDAFQDVLLTHEPYAAVAFWEHATPIAQAQLIHLQTEVEASWAETSGAHIDCPPDEELWPFQKAGVEYALRKGNCLIGDEPGLGKTAQAVCVANEMRAKRVLVLCPAAIRPQWVKMIRRWTTMPWPYVVYPINQGSHGVHPTAAWTVVSYDLARTEPIWQALAESFYDLLILDEGHYLKTVDTRRTRCVFGGGDSPVAAALSERAAATLALTGTPLPNRPREAYTLARGLCFDAIDWMSEESFKHKFNPSMVVEWEDPVTGQLKRRVDERDGRHGELQARMRANFMVRRLEADVKKDMKRPEYDLIQFDETGPVKQALQAERLLDIDPETFEGVDKSMLGQAATVRRMMGEALAPQVADYIAVVLEGGIDKLVVFGWHHSVLGYLFKRLEKYGPVLIDGDLTAERKDVLKQRFIDEPGVRLCLGNIMSLGLGTDGLQAVAHRCLFAEPDWVHGNNEQAVRRLQRSGQVNQVFADLAVAPNSIAERILGQALRKGATVEKALDTRIRAG